MPYLLEDLIVDRVDLVDEGANSEAFIELFKRKEQSKMDVNEILGKMKPEHATVIQEAIEKAKEDLATVTAERDEATQELSKAKEQLDATNEELAKANSELETMKACGDKTDKACDGEKDPEDEAEKAKTGAAFDETETLKSMPSEVRAMFETLKAQKEAAEEEVRKAKDAELTAEAVAKAKELKAIPVDQEMLVGIIKSADSNLLDLLTVVNAAIEGTVLDEVGKNREGVSGPSDAWSKIEAKAAEVAKRDSISKAKAVSVVIKENPDLYKEYLDGGAN